MKTPRLVKGYLIFELVMVVVFGYLLTPSNGADVFLVGPRIGLIVAVFAVFLNPLIGILGLIAAGSEFRKKNKTFLVIATLVVSAAFATLFPIAAVERAVSHAFGSVLAR